MQPCPLEKSKTLIRETIRESTSSPVRPHDQATSGGALKLINTWKIKELRNVRLDLHGMTKIQVQLQFAQLVSHSLVHEVFWVSPLKNKDLPSPCTHFGNE